MGRDRRASCCHAGRFASGPGLARLQPPPCSAGRHLPGPVRRRAASVQQVLPGIAPLALGLARGYPHRRGRISKLQMLVRLLLGPAADVRAKTRFGRQPGRSENRAGRVTWTCHGTACAYRRARRDGGSTNEWTVREPQKRGPWRLMDAASAGRKCALRGAGEHLEDTAGSSLAATALFARRAQRRAPGSPGVSRLGASVTCGGREEEPAGTLAGSPKKGGRHAHT